VGAYTQGHDAQLDRAVGLYPHIERFLQQRIDDRASVDETCTASTCCFPATDFFE
jgi:flagellum-specific ATP synthase